MDRVRSSEAAEAHTGTPVRELLRDLRTNDSPSLVASGKLALTLLLNILLVGAADLERGWCQVNSDNNAVLNQHFGSRFELR
ncbi:hypothetical protein Mapa_012714 [Marchantia paleacea]|nr:hypothetical protein Mapa_012714 [Marchantia paleacea]